MIGPLLRFRSQLAIHDRRNLDSSRILTSVIRGFAGTLTIPASVPLLPEIRSNPPSTLTIVSRLSSRRAGTRFNPRGLDDDGNVANFCGVPPALAFPTLTQYQSFGNNQRDFSLDSKISRLPGLSRPHSMPSISIWGSSNSNMVPCM